MYLINVCVRSRGVSFICTRRIATTCVRILSSNFTPKSNIELKSHYWTSGSATRRAHIQVFRLSLLPRLPSLSIYLPVHLSVSLLHPPRPPSSIRAGVGYSHIVAMPPSRRTPLVRGPKPHPHYSTLGFSRLINDLGDLVRLGTFAPK